jgi:ribosomal protein S27AE
MWHGRRMSLILDHANGAHDDNRLANLRILCPNCNATLETHCGRNAVVLADRRCARCSEPFLPKYGQQRYCSRRCGSRAPKPSRARAHLRRADRPPYAQLLTEIADLGYTPVGRKYGVSDNAIRKWRRAYERAAAQQDAASASTTRSMRTRPS